MLFPYTMLSAVAIGGISPVLLALALVQYPAYGSLLAFNQHRRRMWIALTCVHAVFAIAAFFLVMESKTFG
jgi:hypothetical protein